MNKLAVDLDEVLVPLLRPMMKWHGTKEPQTTYKYLFREVFQCSEDKSKQILHKFYKSEDFANLEPLPNSQQAIEILRNLDVWDRMYIVTGRQDIVRRDTEEWIDKHFPHMFDDIILTNSFTEHEVKKADVCRCLGITLLVDDSLHNCREAERAGIHAVNFTGFDNLVYPWCEENDISFNDWSTILQNK